MNIAGQLRGVESLMYDIVDEPEFFERLLDFSLEVSLTFAKSLIDAGADQIIAGEALCSPNFISPNIYRTYILPRQKIWAKTLDEYGAGATCLHVCGNISPILEDLGKTHTTMLDIDHVVDMKEARLKSGCAVRGNINPAGKLLGGTPEEVKDAAKKVLAEAMEVNGIILGSGCDVSPVTPLENIKMLTTASKLYGDYF
jgi:Uroporphyrinogen-III decarboxylase